MNWETLFQAANLLAMAGWAILVVGPRRVRLLQVLAAYVIPAVLSAGYFVLVAVYFAGAEGGYSSLTAVGALFESEPVRLAGWVHYLAFDLFIGGWIAANADGIGLSRIIQAPVLAATFLFGPVGLLVFLLLQAVLANSPAVAFAVTRQPRPRTPVPTRPWLDLSFAFGVLFLVTLGALAVDERVLNGISVWIKPLKFQASLALHFATLFVLARLLPEVRVNGRAFRGIVAASTAAGLFEIGYIMLQAARGRASHFNNETVLESVMYALMGVGAVVLVVAPFMMGIWLWRDYGRSMRADPLRLAAALGLVLSAVITLVIAGFMSSFWGSHWVGDATSDAGGLPLVGWSQQVGDLRVAHFFASHGMQVLPLLGYAVRNRAGRGSLYVTAGTGGWLLLTVAVFIQALQGQPFLSLG